MLNDASEIAARRSADGTNCLRTLPKVLLPKFTIPSVAGAIDFEHGKKNPIHFFQPLKSAFPLLANHGWEHYIEFWIGRIFLNFGFPAYVVFVLARIYGVAFWMNPILTRCQKMTALFLRSGGWLAPCLSLKGPRRLTLGGSLDSWSTSVI
jgi:hypothetical protein